MPLSCPHRLHPRGALLRIHSPGDNESGVLKFLLQALNLPLLPAAPAELADGLGLEVPFLTTL